MDEKGNKNETKRQVKFVSCQKFQCSQYRGLIFKIPYNLKWIVYCLDSLCDTKFFSTKHLASTSELCFSQAF
jgi:hypothetical protein